MSAGTLMFAAVPVEGAVAGRLRRFPMFAVLAPAGAEASQAMESSSPAQAKRPSSYGSHSNVLDGFAQVAVAGRLRVWVAPTL